MKLAVKVAAHATGEEGFFSCSANSLRIRVGTTRNGYYRSGMLRHISFRSLARER